MSTELLVIGAAGVAVTGAALNRFVERTFERAADALREAGSVSGDGRALVLPGYRREAFREDDSGNGCPLCGGDHRPDRASGAPL